MKDQRYRAIKSLIDSKGITGLYDVFTIIPLSVVREDMQTNYNTLRSRVNDGESLRVKDLIAMADLFGVDPVEVFKLTLNDIRAKSKSRKK